MAMKIESFVLLAVVNLHHDATLKLMRAHPLSSCGQQCIMAKAKT